MNSSCYLASSGYQACERADGIHVSVHVGDWSEVSEVDTSDSNHIHLHTETSELRAKAVEDVT